MAHHLETISKNTIARRIAYLESLDLNSTTHVELEKLLTELISGYSFYTRAAKLSPCFRVRKNIGINHFKNIAELSYPPAAFIKVDGRINRAGESIFYVANCEAIAITEVKAAPGDILTICTLETTKNEFNLSEMGMPEYFEHDGVKLLENTDAGKTYFGDDPRTIEKNIMIRNFLIKQFTKNVDKGFEYEYKITNSISKVLTNDDNFEGFMYPSIAGAQAGINVAIKPKIADAFFKFKSMWVGIVEEIVDKNLYSIKQLAHSLAIKNDGAIEWSNDISKYL